MMRQKEATGSGVLVPLGVGVDRFGRLTVRLPVLLGGIPNERRMCCASQSGAQRIRDSLSRWLTSPPEAQFLVTLTLEGSARPCFSFYPLRHIMDVILYLAFSPKARGLHGAYLTESGLGGPGAVVEAEDPSHTGV